MTEKFQPMVQGEQATNTARPNVDANYGGIGNMLQGLAAFATAAKGSPDPEANIVAEATRMQESMRQEAESGLDEALRFEAEGGWTAAGREKDLRSAAERLNAAYSQDGEVTDEESKAFLSQIGMSLAAFRSLSPTARALRERALKGRILNDPRYVYGENATVEKVNQLLKVSVHEQVIEDRFGNETMKETMRRYGSTATPLNYAVVARQYEVNQAREEQKAQWSYAFSKGEYEMTSFTNDVTRNVSANMQAQLDAVHKAMQEKGHLNTEDQATYAASLEAMRGQLRTQLRDAIAESGGVVKNVQEYYAAIDKQLEPYQDLTKVLGTDPDLLNRTKKMIELSIAGAEAGADIDFGALLSIAKLGANSGDLLMRYAQNPKDLVALMEQMNGPDVVSPSQKEALEMSVKLFSNIVLNKKQTIPGYEKLQEFWRMKYVSSQKVTNPEVVSPVLDTLAGANVFEFPDAVINNRQLIENIENAQLSDKFNSLLLQKTQLYVQSLQDSGAKVTVVNGQWAVTRPEGGARFRQTGGSVTGLSPGSYERVVGTPQDDAKASALLNKYQLAWNVVRKNTPDEFQSAVLESVPEEFMPTAATNKLRKDAAGAPADPNLARAADAIKKGKDRAAVLDRLREAGYTDEQLKGL